MAGSTTTTAVLGLLVLLLYDLCEFGDTVGTSATVPAVLSTTTEFDPEKRGDKKFGDPCDLTKECGFEHSICDLTRKCTCELEFPITNHFDKCGKSANVNESCFFTEQCEYTHQETECKDGHCKCRFERTPVPRVDGGFDCVARNEPHEPERYIDPAMIGVLVGMALMFVIICVVLRLFSNARWRENRTIFNTPNPRLMNVSLLRESKLLHGQERRGSRASVRGPSRQPSMASLRPHSPNSQGSRRGSHTSSTGSVKGSSNHHPNHPSSPTNQDASGAVTVVQVQESNTKA